MYGARPNVICCILREGVVELFACNLFIISSNGCKYILLSVDFFPPIHMTD